MPPTILLAVLFIVTALVCYTVAVWSVRFASRLRAWHVGFFWAGLVTDAIGTSFMVKLAGGLLLSLHSLTGILGIALMLVHTVWATVVLRRQDERAMVGFRRRGVIVWIIWLIPFVTGMVLGMQK